MDKENAFKKSILDNDSLPEFSVGDTVYKGRPPLYQADGHSGFIKVAKGIPFVKVENNED